LSKNHEKDVKHQPEATKPEDDTGLSRVRDKIDSLDRQVQSLISERARLAFRVRETKGDSKAAVDYFRPEREAQVLRGVVERNDGPLRASCRLSVHP
jgi:chorismate mutase/prephenate dehydratase